MHAENMTSSDWKQKIAELEASMPRLELAVATAEAELEDAQLSADFTADGRADVQDARHGAEEAREQLAIKRGALEAARRQLARATEREQVEAGRQAVEEIDRLGDRLADSAERLRNALATVNATSWELRDLIATLGKATRVSNDHFLGKLAFDRALQEFVTQSVYLLPKPEQREPIDLTAKIAAELGALKSSVT